MSQRHVRGVATRSDEDSSDPAGIVARIEGMPTTAEIDFHPGCEIIRRIRRRQADISEVAGTIACRNVQAAAKSDRQMREIAANAAALGVCFGGRSRYQRMFVTEGDVVVHEI